MALGVEDKGANRAAADMLLAKLRAFVADQLNEEEAALFAALVAPGVARAHVAPSGSDGYWSPRALPDALVDAVRDRAIRVEGLT